MSPQVFFYYFLSLSSSKTLPISLRSGITGVGRGLAFWFSPPEPDPKDPKDPNVHIAPPKSEKKCCESSETLS